MGKKSTLKTDLVCRGCGAEWKYTGTTNNTKCPFCGKAKDARKRTDYAADYDKSGDRKKSLIEWNSKPENRRPREQKYRELLRKRVFFKITGDIYPHCVKCGCDDPRILEINHKNGGGNKEMQHGKKSNAFYVAIANGSRRTDDLELLCKPCNSIHYLEMKYGPLPIKVVWSGSVKT